MPKKGKQSMNFTINIDIVTKANNEINDYIKKLTDLKAQMGERLSATFIDDTIKSIKTGQKEMMGFAKEVAKLGNADTTRFDNINKATAAYAKTTQTILNSDKVWLKETTKNNAVILKQLDDLLQKQRELASLKGKQTYRKNRIAEKEQFLQDTGYEGGTGVKDLQSLNSKIKKKEKTLVENEANNLLDNKDLEQEIKLMKDWASAIDTIIKHRKKLQEVNKELGSLSTYVGHKTMISNPEEIQKRFDTEQLNLERQSETPEQIEVTNRLLKERQNIFKETATSGTEMNRILTESYNKSRLSAEKAAETTLSLKQVISRFGIGFSVGQIVDKLWDGVQAAYEFYKSLDKALNEIYIVSNLSAKAVASLKDDFLAMAEDTGMALDDVTRSATLFYQQGLYSAEVMEMTKVTAQFAKVAGIDATDAADKLTAAVNGYCLAAEDASLVADKFNKVAAASAADIDELSTAFSKAAAQANQAGVSMDNYLSYIATMVEATREAPENIGTSLKTIFSRMQQVKEGGTTEDGDTDVNKVETALKSVGIQLRDTQGELRDLEEVLDELGKKWNSLDRNTQAYLGTIIAGTRQQSRFITLMQNWDRVLDLSEQSANSAGQQALMHAKAMDSITSKTQQLKVAIQEFISNISSSDLFKGIIVGVTGLVKAFNSGVGPVKLFAAAIFLLRKPIQNLLKDFTNWFKYQTRWIDTLKKIGKLSGDTTGIKKFSSVLKAQGELFKENSKRINDLQKDIDRLGQHLGDLMHNPKTEGDPGFEQWKKDVDDTRTTLDNTKAAQQELINSNDELTNSYAALSSALVSLYMIFDGMTQSESKLVKTTGDLLQLLLTIIVAAAAFTTAMKVAKAEIKETEVAATGAAIAVGVLKALLGDKSGLGIMALMMVIALIYKVYDALNLTESEMKEAISAAKDALEEYNNALTIEKNIKDQLKRYEELANKVYRTAEEQERLNTLAQDLGDSLELDVITDEFGNLSIVIDDVKDKIEELEYNTEQARKELIKTEDEQIEELDGKWGNWGKDYKKDVAKFYEEYVKGNRASLRNAMGEIDYGLDTEELATSANNVADIIRNLKDSVINDTEEMAGAFGGLNKNWTLTQEIESLANRFNNLEIDSSDWNALFRTFENLHGQINEMTYDKTFNIVEAAVKRWGDAANLTQIEIEQMTDSVMKSLYAGSSTQQIMKNYQEQLNNQDSGYLEDRIYSYLKLKGQSNDPDQRAYYEKVIKFAQQEQEALYKFRKYEQEINEGNYIHLSEYNKLKQEYNFLTEEEIRLLQQKYDIIKGLNGEELALYDNTGIFDEENEDVFQMMVDSGKFDDINNILRDQGKNAGAAAFTEYLLNAIENTDDESLKKQLENVLEGVLSNITISGTMTWSDVHETLETITEDLRSINSMMEEFDENGGITLDTFGELAEIMDSIDIGTLADSKQLDNFLGALDNLQLGFDETTGLITANGDAMESLRVIQEVLTKAKIAATKAQLQADRASLQSQIYTVEAEIAANKALIQYLAESGEETISLQDIQAAGNVAYTKKMGEMAEKVGQLYFDMTADSSSWSKASITNIAAVGEAVKKFLNGELNETNLKKYLNMRIGTEAFEWQYTGSAAVVEGLEPVNGKDLYNVQEVIDALTSYNAKGEETIKELYARMKYLDNLINMLDQIEKSDLSNLGLDPKELEKYIGQLEEIFNLLRKIEGLQNRLNHLDSFLEMTYGKAHAKYLQEKINKTKELIGNQEELVKQQKYLEQTEQNAIKNSSVGNVFSFDEFGNIIIDYKKYLALQDQAADGEMTQKELADKLYEEYQEIHETTNEYYEDLLDDIQEVIDAQQELVDTYIDLEKSVADSIKDTYQKMLDNKLEAIDSEIEALDKLKEARDRANQAKQDSEELSDLQSDLKRAMMDSSGASNTKVLDYQEQIREKLDKMGEDEYTRRLDSLQESLEEEKEQLQRNFDEYFEDWTAFHAMIKERVMGDKDAIMNVLKDSEDYKQASPEERREMEKGWSTQIADSVTELKNLGTDISGVQNSIISFQDSVLNRFDKLLKNGDVSEVGTLLSRVLAEFKIKSEEAAKKKAAEEAAKNASNGLSYNYDYTPTITHDNEKDKITQEEVNKEKQEMDSGKKGPLFQKGDKVKSKNRNWYGVTNAYIYDSSSGTFKKKSGGYFGAFDDKVAEVKSKNGEYYYRLKKNALNWWVKEKDLTAYANGGIAYQTGPAWLDGTKTAPEAVLNATQTKAFLKLADHLDTLDIEEGMGGNVTIESIEFHVDSMSSVEDGEKAFDAFVNKFKEIGRQTGISMNTMRLK